MDVSLDYVSAFAVEPALHAQLIREADAIERSWCTTEPLEFLHAPGCDGRLFGCSKVGYIDEDEAVVASNRDATTDLRFIVEQLCRWSVKHGVVWRLSCEGQDMGWIKSGRCDRTIDEFVREFEHRGACEGLV